MKKILALLAVLLVAFLVFACGPAATTPAPTPTTDGTTTAATTPAATTPAATTPAATTPAATTPAATTPAATTPAATTPAATTPAETTVTTEVTTTPEPTTAPITPGSVYVDIDFDYDNDAIVDKKGNVTCTPVGQAAVDLVEVTHNGVTKEMSALKILDTNQKSWVECTFNNLADAAQLNKLVEEVKGWTVEAFYLNAGRQLNGKDITVGIVCVTEGNANLGKQGWGLADTAGKPYYIFGDGAAWSNGSQTTVAGTDNYIHVVAVYDAVAKTNTLYMNGKEVKVVAAANGFKASEAMGKDSTGEKVFQMGNGFFLGADPTVGSTAADYAATNLVMVDAKIYAGALTAAQAKLAYQNATVDFVPPAEDIFFEANENYTLDNYIELKYTPKLFSYYDSTTGTAITTGKAGTTAAKFWATPIFTKDDLPNGTVIVLAPGYNYRAEGWVNKDTKTETRPEGVTTQIQVVDDAWWGDFTLRAFNVSTDATTAGRDVSAKDYPAFKIYVPRKAVPAGEKVVAFVPAGSTTTAINLVTGAKIDAIEAEGLTIKAGTLYVAYVKDGKTVAYKEIGSPVYAKSVTGGATNMNIFAEAQPTGYMLKHTSWLIKATSVKSYSLNTNLDYTSWNYALNYALGNNYAEDFGKFGKLTITDVTDEDVTFFFDGDTANESYASEIKVDFVYFNYDGSNLAKATGTTWNPLAMNQMELIRYATDMAWGNENGYQTKVWVEAMRTYGGLASVETFEKTWNGTTYQNHNVNVWQNQLIPVQYASALNNYKATITGDVTEESVKAAYDAAVVALAAAQKAFDDAVAANADVKALKDAMIAAETALNAAKQAEYEARYTMEYEKAKSKNSPEHIEAEKVWKEVAKQIFAEDKVNAGKREGVGPVQEAYNTAKAAYDAAVEANADLKALNAQLLTTAADDGVETVADVHKAANTAQTRVDNYKKWAPLYAKFMEEYEKAAGVALWTNEQAQGDMSESAIYKAYKDIASDNRSYPTYNYFYNAATETYVIFVTSGTQKNACENFNTMNKGNALLSGRNWLKIVTEE